MKKLYRKTDAGIQYAEAWVQDDECVYHWGKVGDKGQNRTTTVVGVDEDAIESALAPARAEGFTEIPQGDQFVLQIQFPVNGPMGDEDDLEKRHMLEEALNECLGWTGNGMCDGGDIGSGDMNVFCIVVDVEAAIQAIFDDLGSVGFLEDASIFSRAMHEEELTEHPVPDEYKHHIFNEPEADIVPPQNQEEWESETNPAALRAALGEDLDPNKCRQYAIGCCRRIWHLFVHEDTIAALTFVENLANGIGDASSFDEITERASDVFSNTSMTDLYREQQFDEIAEMGGDVEMIRLICELTDQKSLNDTAVSDAAAAADSALDEDPAQSVHAEMCAVWAACADNQATSEAAEQKFQADLVRSIWDSPFR